MFSSSYATLPNGRVAWAVTGPSYAEDGAPHRVLSRGLAVNLVAAKREAGRAVVSARTSLCLSHALPGVDPGVFYRSGESDTRLSRVLRNADADQRRTEAQARKSEADKRRESERRANEERRAREERAALVRKVAAAAAAATAKGALAEWNARQRAESARLGKQAARVAARTIHAKGSTLLAQAAAHAACVASEAQAAQAAAEREQEASYPVGLA